MLPKTEIKETVKTAVGEIEFNHQQVHQKLLRMVWIVIFFCATILSGVVLSILIVWSQNIVYRSELQDTTDKLNQKRLELAVRNSEMESINHLMINLVPSQEDAERRAQRVADGYIRDELSDSSQSSKKTIDQVSAEVCKRLEDSQLPCY